MKMDVLIPCIGKSEKITITYTEPILTCPCCKTKVSPLLIASLTELYNYNDRARFLVNFPCCNLEHIISCTHLKGFQGKYDESDDSTWEVEELHKEFLKFKEVPDIINEISPSFKQIYEEAQAAEQLGYTQICGGGYRKALEFLIKDYATFLHPDKDKEIAKMELGNCIKKYIDNPSIQIYANRASWLGNDELHYRRYWENKDIFDLGALIEASILAIRIEEEGKKLEIEMPKPPKK